MTIYDQARQDKLISRGKQPFYFTFGFNHSFPYGYVRVWGSDWNTARAEMVQRYGEKWAFQYLKPEEAGVAHYNLELIADYEGA